MLPLHAIGQKGREQGGKSDFKAVFPVVCILDRDGKGLNLTRARQKDHVPVSNVEHDATTEFFWILCLAALVHTSSYVIFLVALTFSSHY